MTRVISRAVSCIALVAIVGCRGWDSPHPPVHLNPNMDTQEKGKAYRASKFFDNGRVMQTPPAGTVARGYLHEDDQRTTGAHPTLQDDFVQTFPGGFASWADKRDRGERQYGIYCAPCHGKAADGQGIVAEKLAVKPPSFLEQRVKDFYIGRIYHAVTFGVNNGNMGSYAAQLSEDDRWAVTYYVRTIQCGGGTDAACMEGGKPKPVITPVTEATIAQGQLLYEAKGCNACHTLDGSPKVGPTWKGLWGKSETTDKGPVTVDEAYIIESILMPNAKIVNGYPPAMPPVPGAPLGELDLKSLSMFIESLK